MSFHLTYEEFAASWPSRDGEFADKFNSLPKYVVSSTLQDPQWNNSTVLEVGPSATPTASSPAADPPR
jgi:hypothetical protein